MFGLLYAKFESKGHTELIFFNGHSGLATVVAKYVLQIVWMDLVDVLRPFDQTMCPKQLKNDCGQFALFSFQRQLEVIRFL